MRCVGKKSTILETGKAFTTTLDLTGSGISAKNSGQRSRLRTIEGGEFLATHKSAEKRSRQNEKRRLRNTSLKSSIKTQIKSVILAAETKDKKGSETALAAAIPAIAKAASKRVFHKKTASRKISKLTKKVNALKG